MGKKMESAVVYWGLGFRCYCLNYLKGVISLSIIGVAKQDIRS